MSVLHVFYCSRAEKRNTLIISMITSYMITTKNVNYHKLLIWFELNE